MHLKHIMFAVCGVVDYRIEQCGMEWETQYHRVVLNNN